MRIGWVHSAEWKTSTAAALPGKIFGPGRARLPVGSLVNHNSPHPLFFVSVASKGLTISLSPLDATHTRVPGSVASKELAQHQNGAQKAASMFGDGAKSARGRPTGVAGVQFMQECSTILANCQYILRMGYHPNDRRAGSGRF